MSKKLNVTDVTNHKDAALVTLNQLLEDYIKDASQAHLKKADLISYWIDNFSTYIKAEESFTPQRLLRYKRGNVIRVNFGFNVGKEFGGLHYAIVIDNDNKRNADVITVIPLSSSDGKEIHERNVDLGTELYAKVDAVQQKLLSEALVELDDFTKLKDSFTATVDIIQKIDPEKITPDDIAKLNEAIQYQTEIEKKQKNLEQTIKILERNKKEIEKMKIGSMALVNQITTVSKQRIYTPKRSEDFLYGISMSTVAMDKINNKLKELFVFGD